VIRVLVFLAACCGVVATFKTFGLPINTGQNPNIQDHSKPTIKTDTILTIGGRAVLDTMEKQMRLSRAVMEPSRAGLYRFGNVSRYVRAFVGWEVRGWLWRQLEGVSPSSPPAGCCI
jgi:hypothetical protein